MLSGTCGCYTSCRYGGPFRVYQGVLVGMYQSTDYPIAVDIGRANGQASLDGRYYTCICVAQRIILASRGSRLTEYKTIILQERSEDRSPRRVYLREAIEPRQRAWA